MNALTRMAITSLPRARQNVMHTTTQFRTMASESRANMHTGMPTNMKELKNSIWLSDPGAYPVIFVLSFACAFAVGFIGYNVVANPDVRITPGRRQAMMRTWEH